MQITIYCVILQCLYMSTPARVRRGTYISRKAYLCALVLTFVNFATSSIPVNNQATGNAPDRCIVHPHRLSCRWLDCIHGVGLSTLLVSDRKGNAKAYKRRTSNIGRLHALSYTFTPRLSREPVATKSNVHMGCRSVTYHRYHSAMLRCTVGISYPLTLRTHFALLHQKISLRTAVSYTHYRYFCQ